MVERDRVEFARESFAANRRVAERHLAEMLAYARNMLDFRHNRIAVNPVQRVYLWLSYQWDKRRLVPALRETRWKVQFYRRVEADLERGDLGSAIEALSLFAPREETTMETIQRIQTSPATVWAIQRSPHIVRVNMLRLRDDLLKIQPEKTR
jgi:hypothetical protein